MYPWPPPRGVRHLMKASPAKPAPPVTEHGRDAPWRARIVRFFDSGHTFSEDERALSYKHRFINTGHLEKPRSAVVPLI